MSERSRLSAARVANLRARAAVLSEVRRFFRERRFLEIESPLLVPSPGLEVHLAAVEAGEGGYLITSPEYQLKRLLAGGLERIYSVCKCFRAGESGAQHNVEFTMLEWYRAAPSLDAIVADTEELVAACARAARPSRGAAAVVVGERTIDVSSPWPRFAVRDLMLEHAGVDVRDADAAELHRRVAAAGVDVGSATLWDDLFFCAWLERVEPFLAAMDRPAVVVDWPVELAALARRKDNDPGLVERFEVYIGGIELANAFGELTDAAEQRARLESDLDKRRARGLPEYPIDERFLAALEEGMPPSAGIALGIDRLVMLCTGASEIRDVLPFSSDEL